MPRQLSVSGAALRGTALLCGAAAVALFAAPAPVRTAPEAANPAAARQLPPAVPASATPPGVWSLQAGGWYIRVDGAAVPIPSIADTSVPASQPAPQIIISPFDRLIAYHANAEGFDWRLIAALIFEESHFDPTSRSDKGAVGLMQVRPVAAEAVGAVEFHTPADNVQTGVRYLRQLDDMFHAASGRDRLAIILAAYNMGPGHVRDAQMLATHFGYDPNRWQDALELMLPLLEQPSVYGQLPNGYAKGSETVAYVYRILERYKRYQIQTASEVINSQLARPARGAGNG